MRIETTAVVALGLGTFVFAGCSMPADYNPCAFGKACLIAENNNDSHSTQNCLQHWCDGYAQGDAHKGECCMIDSHAWYDWLVSSGKGPNYNCASASNHPPGNQYAAAGTAPIAAMCPPSPNAAAQTVQWWVYQVAWPGEPLGHRWEREGLMRETDFDASQAAAARCRQTHLLSDADLADFLAAEKGGSSLQRTTWMDVVRERPRLTSYQRGQVLSVLREVAGTDPMAGTRSSALSLSAQVQGSRP